MFCICTLNDNGDVYGPFPTTESAHERIAEDGLPENGYIIRPFHPEPRIDLDELQANVHKMYARRNQ